MNRPGFVFFLLMVTLIYSGLHYFFYRQIVSGLELSRTSLMITRIVFLAGGLSYYVMLFLRHRFPISLLLLGGAAWFGLVCIGVSFFLVKTALTLFLPQHTRLLTLITLCLTLAAAVYSVANAARQPCIRRFSIPIANLPSDLAGFTILQLSDLHLGSMTSSHWLQKTVDTCNSLNPDLVVITGDLVDHHIDASSDYTRLLKQLAAGNGVFAVTGNHDFYSGKEGFIEFAQAAGITVLENSVVTVAGSLQIAGIDDFAARRFGVQLPSPAQVLKQCDSDKPVILLAHRPTVFEEAEQHGVDLQLSGHFHAGQIPPLDLIIYLSYRYPWGLYRKNKAHIYTTCGTNTWGPPMRLFSRSEIVLFTLKRG